MAQAVIMPKLGNTVESAIILAWHVAVGDSVETGDLLCEVETDKATLEIESSAAGSLLAQLYQAGEDVPVLSNIAVSLPESTPLPERVTKAHLLPAQPQPGISEIPLRGIRKTIAKRMLMSLQTTAQLTLNASADARALIALRRRMKDSQESLGLRGVNINELLLFALSRTLPEYPALNALFENDIIKQHEAAHLGMAVDTERGLLVPVIRDAQGKSLRQISAEAKRLAAACRASQVEPDELAGGTFTMSNMGALGIESFTPLLNPPQVAILGVGSINLKPVEVDDAIEFLPHIGLSLTINHQVVDGAPAARFLRSLAAHIADIDLLVLAG